MNEDLTRFVESNTISNKLIQKVESNTLRESLSKIPIRLKESVDVNENSDAWKVPISFYNRRNYNGRIYNKKLWENVINNQRDIWVGSPMLSDHPSNDSDGNPKDICGVWLDAEIGPENEDGVGLVYGLLVPSGSIGKDLKEHLTNGLKVGTSSSGFGKLMRDGETVDPDTFLIERLSDWVLNPSQGTYFSYEENQIINKSKENLQESVIKENKVVGDSKIAKLEEKKFRRDMESFLESAALIKDPQERLQEFLEIKSYLEDGACPDLKEKIEEKIAAEENLIKTAIKEKLELQEELGIENPRDLKEKLTKIVEDASVVTKEAAEWKSVAEALQEKLTKANNLLESKPSTEYVEYLRTKLSEMKNTYEKVEDKSYEAVKKVVNLNRGFKEAIVNFKEQIKGLQAEKEKFFDEIKESHKIVEEKNASIKEFEDTVSGLNTRISTLQSKFDELESIITEQRKMIEKLTLQNIGLKASNEKQKAKIISLSKELMESQRKLVYNKPAAKKEVKKELTDTEAYFESLYKTYGNAILPYKKAIAAAKTLAEAKKVFYTRVLEKMPASQRYEEMILPENYSTTPEDRIKVLGENKFEKTSLYDRRPEGWV